MPSLSFKPEDLLAIAQEDLDSDRYTDVLAVLDDIELQTGQQRAVAKEMRAQATYGLALCAVAEGQDIEARRLLNRVKQLSSSGALRHLAQRRLELGAHDYVAATQELSQEQRADIDYIKRGKPVVRNLEFDDLRPDVDWVCCAGAFRGGGGDRDQGNRFTQAIYRMKDRGEGWLVGPLGDLLAEVLAAYRAVLDRVDLVVPVPANPDRQRGRGYDITAGLAARVEARFGIPMVQVLQQTKDAPELRGLGQWDRQRALAGLYDVTKPEWVRGRRVLVVDDVITHGTTLREIARTLRAEGAREIYAAALGHTERSS